MHGHAEGGNWTIESSKRTTARSKRLVYLQFKVRIADQTLFTRPSATPSRSRGGKGKLEMQLAQGEPWTIERMGAYE